MFAFCPVHTPLHYTRPSAAGDGTHRQSPAWLIICKVAIGKNRRYSGYAPLDYLLPHLRLSRSVAVWPATFTMTSLYRVNYQVSTDRHYRNFLYHCCLLSNMWTISGSSDHIGAMSLLNSSSRSCCRPSSCETGTACLKGTPTPKSSPRMLNYIKPK